MMKSLYFKYTKVIQTSADVIIINNDNYWKSVLVWSHEKLGRKGLDKTAINSQLLMCPYFSYIKDWE